MTEIEKAKEAAKAAYAAHKEAAKNYGSNSQEAYDTYGAYVKAQEASCAAEARSAQIHICTPLCKQCGKTIADDAEYTIGSYHYSCYEEHIISFDESNIGFADNYEA